jgi:hypothetical protein
MMSERLEEVARQYEQAAAECEEAAQHLRTTARHFRDGDVPRGCAHSWAAWGHLAGSERLLRELAELHASRSRADV